MTAGPRERARITILILLTSAIAWMMLLVNLGSIIHADFCRAPGSGASLVSFQMLLALNPISSIALGWALMLVAMMLPTLIGPIHHIREQSFKHRGLRSVALFVVGYGAIWMVAGSLLIATRLTLSLVAPQSYLPVIVVGIVAVVWQSSPVKQRCLNRGHNHRALAAFGITADLDALCFGSLHAVWCVGSCWALMLFPMLLQHGHDAAMAAVTFVMTSERLDQPGPLRWHLHFPNKLLRIAVAQARIRLRWPLLQQ